MSITLTPAQEHAIENAIHAGLFRFVDEFIEAAIKTLPRSGPDFDAEKARQAGIRIRELRKGVTLDLRGESIRALAHEGHQY